MRITESQLRRIIRQEARRGRLTEMPRRSNDPEMLAAAAAGEKMRTDWEAKAAAYKNKSLKIYKFQESISVIGSALGFGLGTSEEEARRDAMKRVPKDARKIKRAHAYVVSKQEYEEELDALADQVEQLEALQDRLRNLGSISEDLLGLGAHDKRR